MLFLCGCLTVVGCSAAGMELENYGFFSAAPIADGRQLIIQESVERVQRPADADSIVLAEIDFRIDTVREAGQRNWVATRQMTDSNGVEVIDSVWLDRFDLRTLRTFHQDADGQVRLRFDRRAVHSEFTRPDGRVQRRKTLHEAAPYALNGIDLVLSALPLREGDGGSLPVVEGTGEVMSWLRFQVIDRAPEGIAKGGGVVFQPVWLVEAFVGKRRFLYWITEERSILRRQYPVEGEVLIARKGPRGPRLESVAVEPLAIEQSLGPALGTGRPVRSIRMP